MKTERFYLTENGNVLNTRLGCFQTPTGEFLRRVFKNEMEYLTKELTPVRFPKGIEQPELPIWEFLWGVNDEEGYLMCFTRQIRGFKREYGVIYAPKYYEVDVRIVDTDINILIEDPESTETKAELLKYGRIVSIEDVWELGEPNLQERVRRYKILKDKNIMLPYAEHLEWLKRRKIKVARKQRATV